MNHKCSHCGFSLKPEQPPSWHSIFTRQIELFPLSSDLKVAETARCPQCGNLDKADHWRAFGILTAQQVKFTILVIVLLILFAVLLALIDTF
jgi:rubredoxin